MLISYVKKVQYQHFLLSSLVDRLNPIMPENFHVEATREGCDPMRQGNTEYSIGIDYFWDERSVKESIEASSCNILNTLQDVLTLTIQDIWPKISSHLTSLPLPEVHWSGHKLELSFRLDNKSVLELESIDFDGMLI
jgi:hypothetical protein